MHFSLLGIPFSIEQELRKRLNNTLREQSFEIHSYDSLPEVLSENAGKYLSEVLYQVEARSSATEAVVFLNFLPALQKHIDRAFGASIPCCKMQVVQPFDIRKGTVNSVASRIVREIDRVRGKLVRNLKCIRVEIEKSNTTPFLLPAKNFGCNELCDYFDRIVGDISSKDLPENAQRFKRWGRDLGRKAGDGRHAFLSDDGLLYKTPGRAKHGKHVPDLKTDELHTLMCRAAALFRLGIPIDPGFHYDCTVNLGGKLTGARQGCHGQDVSISGFTYLNIYPNDFVRPAGRSKRK